MAEPGENLHKLRVVDLKARLSSLGLTVSGVKHDLIERLQQHLIKIKSEEQEAAAPVTDVAPSVKEEQETDSRAVEISENLDTKHADEKTVKEPVEEPVDESSSEKTTASVIHTTGEVSVCHELLKVDSDRVIEENRKDESVPVIAFNAPDEMMKEKVDDQTSEELTPVNNQTSVGPASVDDQMSEEQTLVDDQTSEGPTLVDDQISKKPTSVNDQTPEGPTPVDNQTPVRQDVSMKAESPPCEDDASQVENVDQIQSKTIEPVVDDSSPTQDKIVESHVDDSVPIQSAGIVPTTTGSSPLQSKTVEPTVDDFAPVQSVVIESTTSNTIKSEAREEKITHDTNTSNVCDTETNSVEMETSSYAPENTSPETDRSTVQIKQQIPPQIPKPIPQVDIQRPQHITPPNLPSTARAVIPPLPRREQPIASQRSMLPERPISSQHPMLPERSIASQRPMLPERPIASQRPMLPERPVTVPSPRIMPNNDVTAVAQDAGKKDKRKKKKKKRRQRAKPQKVDHVPVDNSATDVEIEYIPEKIDIPRWDPNFAEFSKIFDAFKLADAAALKEAEVVKKEVAPVKIMEDKDPIFEEDDMEKPPEDDGPKLSKKKLKMQSRLTVAELKQLVTRPDVVEMHDVNAKDPKFLVFLKAYRNTVPVPRHWCFKRKYLQGKRGFIKPPFDLPDFIKNTGIMEMRAAMQEKEDAKNMKSKQRAKVRPKLGKIDIDYQKLHDAFFKYQTKPKLSIHGDLYYEGKEFETKLREKKPGDISDDLRTGLGMPVGQGKQMIPPPWLIAMQRYGPPPSYPNLKIPGLNAPIPEGAAFGYHAGGWGKPPVDETGKPLYGDVFGMQMSEMDDEIEDEEVDRTPWGELESEEESDESEEEEEDEEEIDRTGLITPGDAGLVTPSGLTSIPVGMETPDLIELRKRKEIEEAMDAGNETPSLYSIVPEKRAGAVGAAMMASSHVYDLGTTSHKKVSADGIEVTLDPSELDLDAAAMTAKYEETIRERDAGKREDLSDMVAEHAAKKKRKKPTDSGKAAKKYKDFKF